MHSTSLRTDPSLQTTTQQFFLFRTPSLRHRKTTIPLRQTKTPDNSNMLHMFNNNTYSDFRTACNYVLIPSYAT